MSERYLTGPPPSAPTVPRQYAPDTWAYYDTLLNAWAALEWRARYAAVPTTNSQQPEPTPNDPVLSQQEVDSLLQGVMHMGCNQWRWQSVGIVPRDSEPDLLDYPEVGIAHPRKR